MTLGATFKSLTQKQIETEKQINANALSANNSIAEVKQNVQNLDTQIQTVNTVIVALPSEYVKMAAFENYKTEVNQKLGSVYTVKGSVADFEALQSIQNKNIGDVYNVLDTGANYVWTDEDGWDKLSETIDLSNYYTKEEIDNMLNELKGGTDNG